MATAALAAALIVVAAAAGGVAADASFVVDPSALSRRFDGIGGLSGGGATSRLLVSYPPEQQSQLLDYLFKPSFGSALHILKVEIGGDAQSTDGSESSHMHTADDLNYERGYEWWLMGEAKARNPDILLYGLPWAFPAWVGNGTGNPFAAPTLTSEYIVKWVEGAKSVYDLDIDYVGIWNERPYDITYILTLRDALDAAGFEDTAIVAADGNWDIANDILENASLAAAVGVIGVHYPGTQSPAAAEQTGKPLWASEDMSTYNDLRGAGCWAKILNQNYVMGNMTATISWNLIASYYEGLPWFGTALMTAVNPWTGNYDTDNMGVLWASAHTTQFSAPGWHYLSVGRGSGMLTQGGSYVTLASPSGVDFTIVIEKMAWAHSQCIRPGVPEFATAPETATFHLAGPWKATTSLHVWVTLFGWDGMEQTVSSFFEVGPDVTVVNGAFSVSVPVDAIITLTTIATGHKGTFAPPPAASIFPTPYVDSFDSYPLFSEASYFADQAGVWEVINAADQARGRVMRQVVPTTPICWSGDFAPYSVIGDEKFADGSVQSDVLIEPGTPGGAFVALRTRHCCNSAGLFFVLDAASQSWILARSLHVFQASEQLATGSYGVVVGTWYTLRLEVNGSSVAGWINGANVLMFTATGPHVSSGWPAIGTTNGAGADPAAFVLAQFDNFALGSMSRLVCPVPAAGRTLSVAWCGDPNTANDEWMFYLDGSGVGTIALKSNAGLCWEANAGSSVVQLSPCDASSAAQRVVATNSTQYPFATLTLGGQGVNTASSIAAVDSGDPDARVTLLPAATGAGAVVCSASDANQLFNVSAGRVIDARGKCMDASCSNILNGCSPLPFTTCDASNKDQVFTYSAVVHTLKSNGNGGCVDLWNSGEGPDVGVYVCDGYANQGWQLPASAPGLIVSLASGGPRCLSAVGAQAHGAQFIIDETGSGQLSLFGSNPTDHCVSACL